MPYFTAFGEDASDKTSASTENSETTTIETDNEYDNIRNIINDFGWCDYDEIANATDDYDSEDSDYSSLQIEYIKICKNMKQMQSLESELAGNTEELRENYQTLKDNEQSLANRTLTAATTAATGIGGMELARGLAEKNADKDAEKSMASYIATMRCTYGGGKTIKAGPDEIELPGGNDANIMKYRSEYFALAKDLKERKAALGMKPGIESEEIQEKTQMGLYDDENTGMTAGAYASLYRAQMLQSEKDQSELDSQKEATDKRVKYGAIAAGAGIVAGVVGNAIINKNVKNRTDELVAKRKSIKSQYNNLAEQLIASCNKNIKETKEMLNQMDDLPDEGIDMGDFITKMKSVELLKDVSELSKIKDIPVCM